ncbi:MAG: hypothetical protein J6W29_06390 [Neisseriaceae bacterium]|nr:hypothetical protein [Neisseriaceae bacterium]
MSNVFSGSLKISNGSFLLPFFVYIQYIQADFVYLHSVQIHFSGSLKAQSKRDLSIFILSNHFH